MYTDQNEHASLEGRAMPSNPPIPPAEGNNHQAVDQDVIDAVKTLLTKVPSGPSLRLYLESAILAHGGEPPGAPAEPIDVRTARAILAGDEAGCPGVYLGCIHASGMDTKRGHDSRPNGWTYMVDHEGVDLEGSDAPAKRRDFLELSIREVLTFGDRLGQEWSQGPRYNVSFQETLERATYQELAVLVREWDEITAEVGDADHR